MPLTPEQYYKNKKWPIIRHPVEKKSIIFSYEDLIDFAECYHAEKITETYDREVIKRHMKRIEE